jgi:hypothetical protein
LLITCCTSTVCQKNMKQSSPNYPSSAPKTLMAISFVVSSSKMRCARTKRGYHLCTSLLKYDFKLRNSSRRPTSNQSDLAIEYHVHRRYF